MIDVSGVHVLAALLGGLFSFLSPCVLPLVPGYVSLMSGVSVEKLKAGEGAMGAVAVRALLFVLGFSVVFVAMGASASAVGGFLQAHQSLLLKIAGVIIILFGIFLLGFLKIPQLYREKRYHGDVGRGPVGTFVLGLAFAFGWTPCVGPILAALLALAATQETVAEGVFLLSVYSLGLGIPFLLTALALNKFLAFYTGFRRHLQWVERVAGVLLIAVGILILTNQLAWLSGYFAYFNELNLEGVLAGSVDDLETTTAATEASERPPAPSVALPLRDGTMVSFDQFRGQVVVVNFWATWCLPCRLEIPHFNTVQREYGGEVQFIGVSVDEAGWSAIEEFEQGTPIDYPVVLDRRQKAAEAFGGVIGLPVTIFLDRQGRIAKRHVGITDIDTLRQNIEELL